jgi:hypothetical protein
LLESWRRWPSSSPENGLRTGGGAARIAGSNA